MRISAKLPYYDISMMQQSFVFNLEVINKSRALQGLLFNTEMISTKFNCYRKDQTKFILCVLLTAKAFTSNDKILYRHTPKQTQSVRIRLDQTIITDKW